MEESWNPGILAPPALTVIIFASVCRSWNLRVASQADPIRPTKPTSEERGLTLHKNTHPDRSSELLSFKLSSSHQAPRNQTIMSPKEQGCRGSTGVIYKHIYICTCPWHGMR